MRQLLYTVSLITLLLPQTIKAQEAGEPLKLSLDESINFAMKHQAKMKNAILDQKSSLARNKEVTGLALPNLKAKGGVNYAPLIAGFLVPNFLKDGVRGYVDQPYWNQAAMANTSDDYLNFALQPKFTTTATAELTQILFDPSVMVALQARRALEHFSQLSVNLTEQELKAVITKAYYDVLIAEKRAELLDKNVERISGLEREIREIYNVGLTEKIDVDRITVTLNNLKTQQTTVKQLLDVAYMSLKFQMGMDVDQQIALTDELDDNQLGAELLTHPFDYENRIEYQMLKTSDKLLSYDLKRYKLGGLPTLAAFGNYGYILYNNTDLFAKGDKWQDQAMIGVQLSVPLFDGFQRRNKAKQARYAYEKNRNDMENLRNGLEIEKENARITLRAGISNLENQKQNMKLAEEVYNISKTKYKEGVGSSLEVMDAETALKEAQTNYFNALYEAHTARISLLKALGEL
ncbi:MAG: TolC family protein [Taibaiella sp.]|nr:TolC family protein [Taibaiella sp.]